jgi:tetratricopeptide (TPR) repeat protein
MLLCAFLAQAEPAKWILARTAHFELWSDAGEDTARTLAAGLERLQAFFTREIGVGPRPGHAVRVIVFTSAQEYAGYRVRPGAEAFFAAGEGREYIVMTAPARGDLRIAAHEYAHLLIHTSGWNLPDWIGEGIADVVSTVQVRDRDSRIGGDLPARSQLLRQSAWMPPAELFAFGIHGPANGRVNEALFYSQSWALADLLMFAPAYAPAFPAFLASLAAGTATATALENVYHVPVSVVFRDVRARTPGSVPLAGLADTPAVRVDAASAYGFQMALAGLHLAVGELERAETIYRAVAAAPEARPETAEALAALGVIALRRGDSPGAMEAWSKAIQRGIPDAELCYRYAALAEARGVAGEQVREALERAVALKPDYDEALLKLALLDNNAGRAADAVRRLRAMRTPTGPRAWFYYNVLATALLELDRRDEAKQAALRASASANTDEERSRASELIYFAETEMTVEIAVDAQGRKQFRTVRVPVNAPPRNPFVEAGEAAIRTPASLDQVECAESGLRVFVTTANGPLALAVPDPSRVQITGGAGITFEFTCGPQGGRRVTVEYSAAGILRGLDLR